MHGGLLNPHIVAQLSHFAPVEQMATIDDARVLDMYTIVTAEITQLSIASSSYPVSIDVGVILEARAA